MCTLIATHFHLVIPAQSLHPVNRPSVKHPISEFMVSVLDISKDQVTSAANGLILQDLNLFPPFAAESIDKYHKSIGATVRTSSASSDVKAE